jgi:hypothetical protein
MEINNLIAELASKDLRINALTWSFGECQILANERLARIKELEQLVEVQLKETANLGKQLDESMASYYKAEDRAEVAIGAYNTCYDRELNLRAEIEVLKANDIRTSIPDGKSCVPCVFYHLNTMDNDGSYYCILDPISIFTDEMKLESCPKPDKGEVK